MRYLLALLAFLLVLGYVADVRQCTTDSNCAAVWDDTSGLPY